jgi:glycosyltransferase involved in cell wall biosynthesis
VISDDFKQLFKSWGIESDRITNIPNWASIEQIHPVDKNNSWSRRFLPNDGFIFMYTGTLGMKHNPEHLYRLAMHYRDNSRAYVVVISEGPGADWLLQRKSQHGLENLLIFPFQPYERLTEAMGAADVLIALLSLDAGAFSVPSKVLSYLCAQRPVLLAVPQENLAAKIVRRHHSGLVVPADDLDAFISAAEKLFSDPILREQFGKNGREYAEKNFGITEIGDRFENIINNLS